MFDHIFEILSNVSIPHLNVLCLLGIALFGGTIGGRVFQLLRIPQVVGYIVIGIVIGRIGFNLIDEHTIQVLDPLNYIALGLIGFMIGGELKADVLRRYGTQFVTVLLFEGIAAFFLVFLLVGLIAQHIFVDPSIGWSLAFLLGAIASATAPASTTDVLWELKARGPLTTMIFGIVAMDDALALFLFAIASSVASMMMGQSDAHLLSALVNPLHEILGAISIGVGCGWILIEVLKRNTDREKILVISLGILLLVIGLATTLQMDMLLASMTLGVVVVNGIPQLSKDIFKTVGGFAPPIYVLFFVLVGAKLNIEYLTRPLLLVAVVYIFGRTLGKMAGSWAGATVSGAHASVRRYLPLCLFSQAGVAIGLSIAAYNAFPGEVGNTVVAVIAVTTLIVQLLGPPSTKLAVTKAGEAGLNISEDDLLEKIRVKDIMDKKPPIIFRSTPYTVVLKTFKDFAYLAYPVIDEKRRLLGVITMENLRQTFLETDTSEFLLADDLMEPASRTIKPDINAKEAKDMFDKLRIDYLPVVDGDHELKGFIDERAFFKEISTRLMELQKKSDTLY